MKRRWIFWILVILFLWIIISRFSEITKLAETLMRGKWQWLAVAVLLQVAYYIVYTGLYQSAFEIVGVRSKLFELLPVTFGSIFLNVAAPSGGASAVALFADDAARRGQSPTRAAIGSLLVLVADLAAFLVWLVGGMIYLFTHNLLKIYEGVAAIVLLLIIGGLTTFLLLGLWRPQWLHKLLSWARWIVNSIARLLKRPDFLDEAWMENTSSEFIEAAMAIAAKPGLLIRTLAIALTEHLVDLTSLYVVFMAFYGQVHFGVLVAGYAMGILFWIVSITPQGIGVVEGMMTLVFTSLGIPIERAAVVALAFRGLSFWIPFGIGFLALRRLRAFKAKKPVHAEEWGVRVIAFLTGVMGIIDVISGLTPSLHNRLVLLEKYSPFGVDVGSHLTSVLAGFALLILATGLWRRKRLAWAITVSILIVSVPVHLIKGLDYEEALLGGVLAIWMITQQANFHARSDPPSTRQGLKVLLAAVLFTLVYGVLGFYLLDRHFIVNGQRASFDLWGAIRQTVVMFTQFYNPGIEPANRYGRYFVSSIYTVGAVTLGYALLMLIRPVLVRGGATSEEKRKATEIVKAHGHSSLADLLLMDDKLYFFSPGGSVIGYTVIGRVALALGDPVGPPEDISDCITAFDALCKVNDWEPSYYQVLPDYLRYYRQAGYHILPIGSEAIIDLANFSLAGGDKKSIRSGVNRMTKLGYQARVAYPPHPPDLIQELHQVSDEWLTLVHGSEKRFSLGWFDEAYLNRGPIMTIQHPGGYVAAFANIVSEYQACEVTIDMMRHRREAEHGQMDFLFVSLFNWAKDQGYATFNMGLSNLAGIGEHPHDPAIERALHYIFEHVNQFYNFKGLHEFKSKFEPTWSPRYLVYPNPASLPAVTIALIRADSGTELMGGSLKRPKPLR
jgi:phosphatidylglycerol lysyltransferase